MGQDVRGGCLDLVEDTNVCAIFFPPEGHAVINGNAVDGVVQVITQNLKVKLANSLFRSKLYRFAPIDAGDVRH